jgi:hypothetical protein
MAGRSVIITTDVSGLNRPTRQYELTGMSVSEGGVEHPAPIAQTEQVPAQPTSGRAVLIAYFVSVAIAMAGWLLFLGWLLRGLFLAAFNAGMT